MNVFPLAASRLSLAFEASNGRFALREYRAGQVSWMNAASISGLFAVDVDGRRFDAANLTFQDFGVDSSTAGAHHAVAQFAAPGFRLEHHVRVYDETALIEQWQVIQATGAETLRITRMDSFSLDIPPADYELLSFSSDWGHEFEPVRAPLREAVILETRFGRSSKGQHPWFALFAGTEGVLSGSVAWSGNWVLRFEPLTNGGFRLSGGLHDGQFAADLAPGAKLESPPIILALGRDLNDTGQQYARVGRRWWYPRNSLSASLPVEWNHWWPYRDIDINESVFLDNAARAAQMGIELCTLDAGWFGQGEEWGQVRGDWDLVNTNRFPRGLRALADEVHALGMKFGLWCEIEGLGGQAALIQAHPDFPALRDGAPLGYVCFGNPAAEEWAYQTLRRLIREYDCDWIKLDFNVDPQAGCSRADHGHGTGDGLYAHYRGYYRTLERIQHDFPDVVLENCSSGGLRIDLGILRRTHVTFLSDPDWPVHDLQIFWGATTMLAPDACLHWSFSEWLNPYAPQTFNPRDPRLMPHQLDYYTRIAMLGACGFSQKLPDLPEWVAQRLADHIAIYKQRVRRFVAEADLYRLTDQPRRDGTGERWCAFQYSLPERSEHLLFVFRLPGAEPERAIRLIDLQPDRLYRIEGFEGEQRDPMIGRDLMLRGIESLTLREEESALLRIY